MRMSRFTATLPLAAVGRAAAYHLAPVNDGAAGHDGPASELTPPRLRGMDYKRPPRD